MESPFILKRLQERIGYSFGDPNILLVSLTHKSYGHEYYQDKPIAVRDNERLEFLGDSILDLIVSDVLLELFPDAQEGRLSKMRAAVVNEKTLSQLAKAVGLHESIRLGKGEALSKGHEKSSILSSTFEALVAAIYLDGGYSKVYPVVRHLFLPLFIEESDLNTFCDHKTRLQELTQAKWKITPTYHLLDAHGPDHAKTFKMEVRMQNKALAVATGASKKEAEQNAAQAALLDIHHSV